MIVGDDSDETLMQRYARGDVAAFELLYRRHELRTWRYLERSLRNRATADELMQEVWFAVARDAARYAPTARFTTWLFTIAHNRLIDWFRANRRHASLDAMGFESGAVIERLTADASETPLAAAVAREQATALIQAVESLPQEQREAFLLQVEGDFSVEEISQITEVSFEATKSRLRYARAKLRELLKEHA